MNIHELMQTLNTVQYRAAVVEELISHLQRCIDEDIEIPIDIEDGRVPPDVILEMKEQLGKQRDALLSKLELAEKAEVTGVSSEDFDIG